MRVKEDAVSESQQAKQLNHEADSEWFQGGCMGCRMDFYFKMKSGDRVPLHCNACVKPEMLKDAEGVVVPAPANNDVETAAALWQTKHFDPSPTRFDETAVKGSEWCILPHARDKVRAAFIAGAKWRTKL